MTQTKRSARELAERLVYFANRIEHGLSSNEPAADGWIAALKEASVILERAAEVEEEFDRLKRMAWMRSAPDKEIVPHLESIADSWQQRIAELEERLRHVLSRAFRRRHRSISR